MATNEQAAEHFAKQTAGDFDGLNMFVIDNVLYSYGLHWPLACWSDGIAYVNGDRRSQSSTIHVGVVTKALTKEGVSFRMATLKDIKGMINV